MDQHEKMETMFALQARLNDETNGPGWREGVTKQGKVVNWRRCIVMETAELIDSFPWKHWKSIDAQVDRENVKIELVDIWHFVMSEALRCKPMEEAVAMAMAKPADEAPLRLPERWDREADRRLDAYLAPYEALMAEALREEGSVEALTATFWRALTAAGMAFDELYRLYIGKNALNQFRQMHGYKEGTYQKVWRGREDNAVMQAILAENSDIGYDELLQALEAEYAAL